MSIASQMVKADLMATERLRNGWPVRGIFEDKDLLHGLAYNRHIDCWFHVWWNLRGKCVMPGSTPDLDLSIYSVDPSGIGQMRESI